ncbi:hypothetical protein O3G_MSEX010263, partial [Manduca sexta]
MFKLYLLILLIASVFAGKSGSRPRHPECIIHSDCIRFCSENCDAAAVDPLCFDEQCWCRPESFNGRMKL